MSRSSSLVRLRPFLLLAILVAAVLYYSYPMALRLQNGGHFLAARPLYLISAVAGNLKAQHNLATMHQALPENSQIGSGATGVSSAR